MQDALASHLAMPSAHAHHCLHASECVLAALTQIRVRDLLWQCQWHACDVLWLTTLEGAAGELECAMERPRNRNAYTHDVAHAPYGSSNGEADGQAKIAGHECWQP